MPELQNEFNDLVSYLNGTTLVNWYQFNRLPIKKKHLDYRIEYTLNRFHIENGRNAFLFQHNPLKHEYNVSNVLLDIKMMIRSLCLQKLSATFFLICGTLDYQIRRICPSRYFFEILSRKPFKYVPVCLSAKSSIRSTFFSWMPEYWGHNFISWWKWHGHNSRLVFTVLTLKIVIILIEEGQKTRYLHSNW